MTWEIVFVLVLLVATIVCLIKEWAPPAVSAMAALSLLMVTQILSIKDALSVFSNPAPITIGALFIITYSLEKTGGLDSLAGFLRRHLPKSLSGILLSTATLVAVCSAFINNTPIVALFMPLLLGLARARSIAPSKLLIPLSYASIMGGCCTLIGTSTNIIVAGIMRDYGMAPVTMFELAKVGVPLMIIGITYMTLISPKIIPERHNITASLSEDQRRTFFCQLLVQPESSWVGKPLLETEIAEDVKTYRIVEIRRKGATLALPINQIVIEPYDRILISAASQSLETVDGETHFKKDLQEAWGTEALSTLQGGIMEGVISQHSHLIGKTIQQARFRQEYGMLVLAIHRQGRNLTRHFKSIRLQFGDTLLLLGPQWHFDELRSKADVMLLDEFQKPKEKQKGHHVIFPWIAIASVVLLATFNIMPIVAASILGAVFILATRVITPEDAFQSVDWSILFLIFGMLGVGLAMETTGAAKLIAESSIGAVSTVIPEDWLPYVALSVMILLTSVLTEMLSNNATAAVMAPVAYNLAIGLGLDPRPFTVGVMFAASLAFVTPIGYQTNTMVYNAGGYRFTDFVRVGLPLNLTFWMMSSWMIPIFWPFK
ncbi:MAG: SLC13 family permease [Verrucomicrobiota bacterium]